MTDFRQPEKHKRSTSTITYADMKLAKLTHVQPPQSVEATWNLALHMPLNLPNEMVDMITDHLWDDKLSLRACTLVCKQWLFSATSNLFRDITATDDGSCHKFMDLGAFLSSSSIRSSIVRRSVRYLHLANAEGVETPKPITIPLNLLADIMRRCPRVRHVCLTGVRWQRNPKQPIPAVLCPAVTTLSLFYGADHLIPDVTGIFTWFPSVHRYDLQGGYMPMLQSYDQPTSEDAYPAPFPPLMSLSSLSMTSDEIPAWALDSIADTATVKTLNSLSIVLGNMDQVEAVGRLLESARHSLVHLHLDLTSPHFTESFLSRMCIPMSYSARKGSYAFTDCPHRIAQSLQGLSRCRAIERLQLTSRVCWDIPPVTTTPACIERIISIVEAQNVKHLILEFTGNLEHLPYQLTVPEWRVVDYALAQHPIIQAVEISWDEEWNAQGTQAMMCGFFPCVYNSGKLLCVD
ncbi:hypothetical protein BDW22DRAFT_1354664 [Trametopsis cervina]|nr:hypothetical protein BDW22DRAFT_1354664 [Trametopsis cervina]